MQFVYTVCSYQCDFSIEFSAVLTILGATVAFIIGICQYRKSQDWKKAEFVYQLHQNFIKDFNVKRATSMLDYAKIDIRFLEYERFNKNPDEKLNQNQNFFTCDDKLLINALRNHNNLKPDEIQFKPDEMVVRVIFDDFFEKLGHFNKFIDRGLVTADDIERYLIYWINIIGNIEFDPKNRKMSKVRKQMWIYLDCYEYDDVIDLCKKFKFEIPRKNERQSVSGIKKTNLWNQFCLQKIIENSNSEG